MTTRKPAVTPKPFRGWAVFDSDGRLYEPTVAATKKDSIRLSWELCYVKWGVMKHAGFVVRRVTVTPERGKR